VKFSPGRIAGTTAFQQLLSQLFVLSARIAVLLLFALSTAALSPAQTSQASAPSQPPSPRSEPWSGPWTHGSVTAGYTYLYADQGGGQRLNLSGWFVKPSFSIARGWSAFADFTNYYGENRKGPLNSHGFTFGAQKGFFRSAPIQPSLFAEAGDLRLSNVTITNSFLFNIGGNLLIPFDKHLSLAITPGEYVMIAPPNQPIHNDFNSKVGLNFPF
jgi:hypothetical protein